MDRKALAMSTVLVWASLGCGGPQPEEEVLSGPDPFARVRADERTDVPTGMQAWLAQKEERDFATAEEVEASTRVEESRLRYRDGDIPPEQHQKLTRAMEALRASDLRKLFPAQRDLERMGDRGLPVADYLTQLVDDRRVHVRLASVRLISSYGSPKHLEYLIPRLRDEELEVRKAAFGGIKRLAERYFDFGQHKFNPETGKIEQVGGAKAQKMMDYNPYADSEVRDEVAEMWAEWYEAERRKRR